MRQMDLTVRVSRAECNGEAGVDRWSTMSMASWAGRGRASPREGGGGSGGLEAAIDDNVLRAVRRVSERARPAGAFAIGPDGGDHPLAEESWPVTASSVARDLRRNCVSALKTFPRPRSSHCHGTAFSAGRFRRRWRAPCRLPFGLGPTGLRAGFRSVLPRLVTAQGLDSHRVCGLLRRPSSPSLVFPAPAPGWLPQPQNGND